MQSSKLNPYQWLQLSLVGLVIVLFLDLWISLQMQWYVAPELKGFLTVFWGIILFLMDPKELLSIITKYSSAAKGTLDAPEKPDNTVLDSEGK